MDVNSNAAQLQVRYAVFSTSQEYVHPRMIVRKQPRVKPARVDWPTAPVVSDSFGLGIVSSRRSVTESVLFCY